MTQIDPRFAALRERFDPTYEPTYEPPLQPISRQVKPLPVVADNEIRSSVANELREREQRRLKSMLPQIVADYVAGMVNADLVAKYRTTGGLMKRILGVATPEQQRSAWKARRMQRNVQSRGTFRELIPSMSEMSCSPAWKRNGNSK